LDNKRVIILPVFFLLSILLADTKTVAISYFDNTSGVSEYASLSKGLADMLITDLSNVKSIQIVEREKLESLLKEIDLGEGKFIDPNTAQKLGKGLGAGYMLTGSYLIMGETMRIDARLVDVGTGEISMAEEITGEKNSFFELEKDLVNKLVASLNLGLSKSEERRIKKVQTESFESFSAYSSSLDALDNGRYEESVEHLKKAVEYDEDFEIAWDRLDDLQEKLDKLVKARSVNLPAKTIEMIDKAFSTRNQADVEMMSKMIYAIQEEIDGMQSTVWSPLAKIMKRYIGRYGMLRGLDKKQELHLDSLKQVYKKKIITMAWWEPEMKELRREIEKTMRKPKFDLYSEENLQYLSGKFRSTTAMPFPYPSAPERYYSIPSISAFDEELRKLEDVTQDFVNKFDQYISTKRYLDSKEFDPNLGGSSNPFKIEWEHTINRVAGMEMYIGFFINLEEWYGIEGLTIKDTNSDEKPVYQVLDDLIIDHGNKMLNAYPYTNDVRNKRMVERAILRKSNPDIYSAYRWISRNTWPYSSFRPFRNSLYSSSWSSSGKIPFDRRIKSTTISKEVLHGLSLIPGRDSSKPGWIKELKFSSLYKEQYKLMQEFLPGIYIGVREWEDDLRLKADKQKEIDKDFWIGKWKD
jgi:TolB-like protein|tara:strand:+ start:1330 stop:3243 length:1914 start_codon:yes stop_codon:yes gene_type:complete